MLPTACSLKVPSTLAFTRPSITAPLIAHFPALLTGLRAEQILQSIGRGLETSTFP